MSEITVVDPIPETNTSRALTTSTSTSQHDTSPEPFDSERVPVTLGTDIRRFLRVANRVEPDDPRIAYLCGFLFFFFHITLYLHALTRSVGRIASDMQLVGCDCFVVLLCFFFPFHL